MRRYQERCDACGRFVPECSLVIDDVDDEDSRCICKRCEQSKKKKVEIRLILGHGDSPPKYIEN